MTIVLMEKSLAKLLSEHINVRYGGNQAAFARAHDFKTGTLNRWVKGAVTFPQIEARRQIARALGISHIDLLVAIGELDRDEVPEPGAPLPRPEPPEITRLLEQIQWNDEIAGLVSGQLKIYIRVQNAEFRVVPTATVTASALAPQIIGGELVKEKPEE